MRDRFEDTSPALRITNARKRLGQLDPFRYGSRVDRYCTSQISVTGRDCAVAT
jgi:hypothetical protein